MLDVFGNDTRYLRRKRLAHRARNGMDGRMEAYNNDLVIRYLDRAVVKDDGYEAAFKAGVTVEVEV